MLRRFALHSSCLSIAATPQQLFGAATTTTTTTTNRQQQYGQAMRRYAVFFRTSATSSSFQIDLPSDALDPNSSAAAIKRIDAHATKAEKQKKKKNNNPPTVALSSSGINYGSIPRFGNTHADSSSVGDANEVDGETSFHSPPLSSGVPAWVNVPPPNPEQQRAIDVAVTQRRSMFITGGAGTGKTVLLHHIASRLPPEKSVVTASTGVAAFNVRGCTVHSFFGDRANSFDANTSGLGQRLVSIGGAQQNSHQGSGTKKKKNCCGSSLSRGTKGVSLFGAASQSSRFTGDDDEDIWFGRREDEEEDLERPGSISLLDNDSGTASSSSFSSFSTSEQRFAIAQNMAQNVKKRFPLLAKWRSLRTLIIDEVSMLSAELFDILDEVAQILKGRAGVPFGGLQVILCGDFLQLPPVASKVKKASGCGREPMAFASQAWKKLDPTVVNLKTVERQQDPVFVKFLDRVRFGEFPLGDGTAEAELGARLLEAARQNTKAINKQQEQEERQIGWGEQQEEQEEIVPPEELLAELQQQDASSNSEDKKDVQEKEEEEEGGTQSYNKTATSADAAVRLRTLNYMVDDLNNRCYRDLLSANNRMHKCSNITVTSEEKKEALEQQRQGQGQQQVEYVYKPMFVRAETRNSNSDDSDGPIGEENDNKKKKILHIVSADECFPFNNEKSNFQRQNFGGGNSSNQRGRQQQSKAASSSVVVGREDVALTRGCRVMLLRNIDTASGLVNGSIGHVTGFLFHQEEGNPKTTVAAAAAFATQGEGEGGGGEEGQNSGQEEVKKKPKLFSEAKTMRFSPATPPDSEPIPLICFPTSKFKDDSVPIGRFMLLSNFDAKATGGIATGGSSLPYGHGVWHLPLRHAWALTIHKCQGLTLDAVDVSMRGVFEAGQTYVALSRVKAFAGLHVSNLKPSGIHADPEAVSFYRELEGGGGHNNNKPAAGHHQLPTTSVKSEHGTRNASSGATGFARYSAQKHSSPKRKNKAKRKTADIDDTPLESVSEFDISEGCALEW